MKNKRRMSTSDILEAEKFILLPTPSSASLDGGISRSGEIKTVLNHRLLHQAPSNVTVLHRGAIDSTVG